MTKDDLIDLFELDAKPAEVGATGGAEAAVAAAEPESGTALVLDDWGLRKGREILAGSELLRAALGQDKMVPAGDDSLGERLERVHTEQDELAAADFFGAAYLPDPDLAPACADKLRHEFVGELLQTPEYRALHTETTLDEAASEIAAAAFSRQFCELAKQEQPQDDRHPGGQPGGDMRHTAKVLGAVGQALQQAGQEVQEHRDAEAVLGCGTGMGGAGSRLEAQRLAALYKRVREDARLRRIMELAGRWRRAAMGMQRRRWEHGRDEVVGVEQGGDVPLVLPHELCLLGEDGVLGDLQLKRLADRQLPQLEVRAAKPVAKGPVVVFVDESGSMAGEPEYNAKALALAMGWVAQHQKRWLCLCGFRACSTAASLRTLVIPPGERRQAELLDWVSGGCGGGTSLRFMDGDELDELYRQTSADPARTDLVLVTDASVHDLPVNSFAGWKQRRRAKLFSIVIGESAGDQLPLVSDRVWEVGSLDVSAVQDVLAI